MTSPLDDVLRELDPAVTAPDLDPVADVRAREVFARIVATDPHTPEAASTPPPRRHVRRRLVAIAGAAAAGTTAVLVLPGMLGTDEAMAAWTATPHPVSGARAEKAQRLCIASAKEDVTRLGPSPNDASVGHLRPVVTEARGPWTLVYVNDHRARLAEFTCLLRDGHLVATGGSVPGADAEPLPPVAPDSASAAGGAVMSTSGESVRSVTGRVGSDVIGLELHTTAMGTVTATVESGYFAAWWPDSPVTANRLEREDPDSGLIDVTAVLRDGTRHTITVDELTGFTPASPSDPASGGTSRGG